MLLVRWLHGRWGAASAWAGGLAFVLNPISVLMHTSAQPDVLATLLVSSCALLLVMPRPGQHIELRRWSVAVALGLVAAVIKYPVVVPWLPLLIFLALRNRDGAWRIPPFQHLGVVVVCGALFLCWHVYRRAAFPDVLQTDERLRAMFLLGDLTRFLHPAFYLKPVITLSVFLGCGVGALVIMRGILKREPIAWFFAVGTALYYIVIPTVADQYYYLYALVPLSAAAVGRGVSQLTGCGRTERHILVACSAAIVLPLLALLYPYVLRRDQVIIEAAAATRAATKTGKELVLFAPNHDRVIGRGTFNPAFFFFSGLAGWIRDSRDPADLLHEARSLGADFLVITSYSPDLEVWWSRWMPDRFKNDPGFSMFAEIPPGTFPAEHVRQAKNWIVVDLRFLGKANDHVH